MAITLPYRFDTSSVWRTILKGAVGLNTLLVFCILYTLLISRQWSTALGLTLVELVVFAFTRLFVRFQTGSVGTLSSDRVVIEPNLLLGIALPGPKGPYTLDRFSACAWNSGPAPGVRTFRAGGRTSWCGWWATPGRPISCWRSPTTGRGVRSGGSSARCSSSLSKRWGHR